MGIGGRRSDLLPKRRRYRRFTDAKKTVGKVVHGTRYTNLEGLGSAAPNVATHNRIFHSPRGLLTSQNSTSPVPLPGGAGAKYVREFCVDSSRWLLDSASAS